MNGGPSFSVDGEVLRLSRNSVVVRTEGLAAWAGVDRHVLSPIREYVLYAVGLLAADHPDGAAVLARASLTESAVREGTPALRSLPFNINLDNPGSVGLPFGWRRTRAAASARSTRRSAASAGCRCRPIAAVNGAAVGAGLNLGLAADLRIVADDARLLSGFLKIGAHPGGGHLHLPDRVASRDTIAAIAIFGEEVSGSEAVRLGLAWKALPADQVEAEAISMAARVAQQPELARAVTRTFRLEVPGSESWDAAM
jgi:enoyl-CoA hydratase/isomerase-like protein